MSVLDRAEELIMRLSDRERGLLALMVAVLTTMALVLGSWIVSSRLGSLDDDIAAKREALDILVTQRDDYLANAARNASIREELENNALRLSTFIEARAVRASLPRPRDFRDTQQSVEGGITALATTAQFDGITIDQVGRFLTNIEEADELVFTRQMSIAPARRGVEGLQLEITLVTFRRDAEEL